MVSATARASVKERNGTTPKMNEGYQTRTIVKSEKQNVTFVCLLMMYFFVYVLEDILKLFKFLICRKISNDQHCKSPEDI